MKDDFFSFHEGPGNETQPDVLENIQSFTNLKEDTDDVDVDLLSNWSLDLDDADELASLRDDELYQAGATLDPNIHGSTRLAGFQAKFSVMEPLVDNSLWISTPRASPAERLQLPDLNDEIFGFRLLYELGAGAFAKVFLAMQGDLADREVVLKISAIEGTEPQTLAQLQHTHIVPIYSVHEDKRSGLRAVCMPYFGGAALSNVLEDLWKGEKVPGDGQTLLAALDRVSGPEPATKIAQRIEALAESDKPLSGMQSAHTARGVIAGLSYVQTAAWIVCRLAEGLQHSHERNVIHRDIKPSNILMSAEGQPLLLDFNVSQAVDCNPDDASMGGTLSYMSPEHLRAMLNHDASNTQAVNHRSDIYSLGLVLYEMLCGINPFAESSKAWFSDQERDNMLRERNREVDSLKARSPLDIPWSLESILRKSMAPCPLERYRSAAQLADDLTRFLEDLPLKYAPELSRTEQARKWIRRHPRLTTTGIATLIAAALIIPGGILLSMTRDDLAAKQSLLTAADASEYARKFRAGAIQSLYLIKTVTPDAPTLATGVTTCEETLAIFKVLTNDRWQQGIYWRSLGDVERRSLGEKVRELLLELAEAKVRLSSEPESVANSALQLVLRAEQIADLPPSRALLLERARYLTLLRLDADAQRVNREAEAVPAVTAHDLYMLGSAHARQGTDAGLREAVKLLSQSIALDRKQYWPHFERALCQESLNFRTEAIADLGTCAGILPQSSWAHFNLGCLLDRENREISAVESYSAAIKYDPRFRSAYFNRGLAYLEMRDFQLALQDFQKVGELGRDDPVLAAAQAMALEGLGRSAEADKLFAQALDRSEALDQSEQTTSDITDRISLSYAFAISPRAPQIARRVFEKIIKVEANHPQALYGQGMLSMHEGRLEEAVDWFDKSVNADSRLIEPLRYRAISLARLGKFKEAVADAEVCLQRDDKNPENLYAAACVTALSAKKLGSRELQSESVSFLQQALDCGADKDRVAMQQRALSDPDLSALREDPDFQQMTGTETHRAPSEAAKNL